MTLADISFLYVEDDPPSRHVMELLFSKALNARNIVIFEDSTDFESRLRALNPTPDVILLDIHVQPYDGFEMLRIIRQIHELRQAKVVALTASVMNEEVDAIRAKGFDGTISKPLSMSTFPGLIQDIVAGESVWHIA